MALRYMKHPDLEGGAQVADDPTVIAAYEARGWQLHTTPEALNPDAPNTGNIIHTTDPYDSQPVLTPDEVEALKGKALEAALEDAGLPRTGTADEKRDRLAEYEAALANPTPEKED